MTKRDREKAVVYPLVLIAFVVYNFLPEIIAMLKIVAIVIVVVAVAFLLIYLFVDFENDDDFIEYLRKVMPRNSKATKTNSRTLGVKSNSNHQGDIGELEVNRELKHYNEESLLIEDIMLEANNGTTQVDHIFITRYGIFVIETKNFSGWIFGNPNSKKWTQSLASGKKYQFQNPIHQNYLHLKTLQVLSGLPESYFHNIVVFTRKSTFKTELPKSVMYLDELLDYILLFDNILLSSEDMNDFYEAVKYKYKISNTSENIENHIGNLNTRHNRNTNAVYR
jgi:restriction system protein